MMEVVLILIDILQEPDGREELNGRLWKAEDTLNTEICRNPADSCKILKSTFYHEQYN